jgi:hypothetical protein
MAASFWRTGDIEMNDGTSSLEKALNPTDTAKLKRMILDDSAMPPTLVNIVKTLSE